MILCQYGIYGTSIPVKVHVYSMNYYKQLKSWEFSITVTSEATGERVSIKDVTYSIPYRAGTDPVNEAYEYIKTLEVFTPSNDA